MKTFTHRSVTGTLFYTALLAFVTFAFASCAKKIVFSASPIVPAAQGKVKMKQDKNNNYALDIKVTNLAEPERLEPARKYYVVWIETESNGTKNIGQLVSSTGFLSKKLKASLEAVTSFKPTRVFITAEDDASIQYPGMQVVLRTDRF